MNKDKIEYIRQKYNIGIIEKNGEYLFNASDIGELLELKQIRNTIRNVDKKIIKTKTTGGIQKMIFLDYTCVCKVLTKSRKPNVLQISTDFGIDILRTTDSCIEAEILNNLKIAFCSEIIIDQYFIDNYKIDLYIPEYKLAIEIDEDHHNLPNNIKLDSIREQHIKDKLGCEFLRVKPYSKDFNIFKLVNEIYLYIKNMKSDKIESLEHVH